MYSIHLSHGFPLLKIIIGFDDEFMRVLPIIFGFDVQLSGPPRRIAAIQFYKQGVNFALVPFVYLCYNRSIFFLDPIAGNFSTRVGAGERGWKNSLKWGRAGRMFGARL